MKKIISLFQRNYDGDHFVRNEVVPGAEWVIAGEGVATRKFDGTCCLMRSGRLYRRSGRLYRRYDAKKGRTPPLGFESAQEPDSVTGHCPGWIPVRDGTGDQYHLEAFSTSGPLADGTYELCGPKINGNPDHFDSHVLIPHGKYVFAIPPARTFEDIRDWLALHAELEGIVWHHPDGRMVKIKRKDFKP